MEIEIFFVIKPEFYRVLYLFAVFVIPSILKHFVKSTCHSSYRDMYCHHDIPTSRCYQDASVDVLPQNYRVNQNNLFSSVQNKPGGVGCRWNATLLIILRGCDSGNFLGVHYPTLSPTVHLESWNPNHSTCLVLDCLVLK